MSNTRSDLESFFERILEIFPGLMIWILLFSPVWGGKTIPYMMADLLVILSIYWLYRSLLTTIGTALGYQRYLKSKDLDWLQLSQNLQQQQLPDQDNLPKRQFLPKHLIMYPQRVPMYEVLHDTLDGLRKQNYPLEYIYVAISFEERSIVKMEPGEYERIVEQLKNSFPDFGDRLMFFVHPRGIPGEAIGAAPNRTWGVKNAVQELEKRGENIADFLVTSPDEDIIFHPQYLAAATYQYLISDKRKQKFYQTALYTFNNNYWNVPILIRVLAASLTIPVLASSVVEKHKRETYSCYSVNLEVMRAVNYWDVSLGIDDTTFYWRPYFYFKGDWECEVFYIPLSADAIYHPAYLQNHRDQYKQYVRWGWGVISFPIAVKGLLTRSDIPLFTRITKLWHVFEVFVLFKVLAFLITFATPIILLLNPEFSELVISVTLPSTISQIMSLSVVFIIPATIYKILIAPPPPAHWSKLRYLLTILVETPMNIVVLFTFSFLPFIEASTRMMFGQKSARMENWSDKHRPK